MTELSNLLIVAALLLAIFVPCVVTFRENPETEESAVSPSPKRGSAAAPKYHPTSAHVG